MGGRSMGNEWENPYNIFDNRGRPKNILWSVVSAVCGMLSITLSIFGWVGLIFGVAAIIFFVMARRSLGYINGWAIAGLLTGIFGTVFSTALIIISFVNPALLTELFGFISVPGATDGTTPTSPSTPSDPNSGI